MSFLNKVNWKHYESYFKDYKIGDPKVANELLRKDGQKDLLRELVSKEKDRIWSFSTNPIKSVKELQLATELVIKTLNDWDSNFIRDINERDNTLSAKQSAILLRIINSINVGCYYNNINRQKFWEMVPKDDIKLISTKTINKDEVTEETFTDETKIIADFKIIKDNFDDIMECKLLDHQILSVNFLITRPNGCGIVASSVGTGKTIVGLSYGEFLISQGLIDKIVVIAPLIMKSVWKSEILKHTINKDLSKYEIYNYESILSKKFTNTENSLVLLDESHKLKNSNAKRFKEFIKYKWKYVVPLSATIVSNKLSELDAIFKLMGSRAPVKKGEINLSAMSEHLIRVPKSSMNLPTLTIKEVGLDYDNFEEYKMFEDDLLDEIKKDKETALKEGIRPPNELVKLLRLNQASSNRNIIFQNKIHIKEQIKFKALMEIIEEYDESEQFIIWSNFVPNIKELYDELSEYFSVGLIYGEVKQSDRDIIIEDFKIGKYKIILANPSTMNCGITLTNSRLMIFYDRDFSSIKFIQSLGRSHRYSQTRDCIVYNLFYNDTIEERIIEVLKKKEEMINDILENGTSTEDIKIGLSELYKE
jgi:SNF2 family DNA or RNA helicase